MLSARGPIGAVSQRLESFFSERREEASQWGPEAELLTETGIAALTGGKRLRARFCLAGWRAVAEAAGRPQPVPDSLIAVAAALEVFQSAALVHDDLIDNSDTRRGRPAAHRALEAHHRAADWTGDAADFGRAGAVLLGDLLVAWSDDLFEEGLAEAGRSAPTVRRQYATMRRDVTVGQFLDVAEESAFRAEPDERHAARALRVAMLKSASYSVVHPLLVGAGLADADDDQRRRLVDFGEPLGLAFQLRDDVLGVFGDPAVTGKPAGDDLREGKRTVLIAYAREAVPAGQRRIVDELLGDPDLDDRQVEALRATIASSGALARVEDLIARYVQHADRALAGAPLGTAAVGELRDLLHAATSRQS